jgi:hypothetical protein
MEKQKFIVILSSEGCGDKTAICIEAHFKHNVIGLIKESGYGWCWPYITHIIGPLPDEMQSLDEITVISGRESI